MGAVTHLVGHDGPESLAHLADPLLRPGRAEDDAQEARGGRDLAKVLEDDRVPQPGDEGDRLVHEVDGGDLDVARLGALGHLLDEEVVGALGKRKFVNFLIDATVIYDWCR